MSTEVFPHVSERCLCPVFLFCDNLVLGFVNHCDVEVSFISFNCDHEVISVSMVFLPSTKDRGIEELMWVGNVFLAYEGSGIRFLRLFLILVERDFQVSSARYSPF